MLEKKKKWIGIIFGGEINEHEKRLTSKSGIFFRFCKVTFKACPRGFKAAIRGKPVYFCADTIARYPVCVCVRVCVCWHFSIAPPDRTSALIFFCMAMAGLLVHVNITALFNFSLACVVGLLPIRTKMLILGICRDTRSSKDITCQVK